MKIFATLKIALRALWRNKMRSVLTTLGIIIGVGAVIAMVGIGNGAKTQIEGQIAMMGQNVVMVMAGNFTMGGVRTGWGGASTLIVEDAEAIAREVVGVAAVSPEVQTGAQLTAGNQNWSAQVLGQSPDYFTIRQWVLADGDLFTEQDVRGATKVCVIGATVAEQLFGRDDPIGASVRIRNVPFTVLGVLQPKGLNMMGMDQDNVVIVPYTSAMKRLMRTTSLRTILVQAATPDVVPSVQEQITALLRERHRIGAGRDDDFTVRTQQEIAQMATSTSRTMTMLLGAIAGVSLIVGGIGIMNIMLVSVTERTREIGIRMAVGAHRRDILLQFLAEAFTLSSIGGLLGISVGIGAAKILVAETGWPLFISPDSVIIAFVFSAAVGIFFGFYPARKASKLDPIEALRYE